MNEPKLVFIKDVAYIETASVIVIDNMVEQKAQSIIVFDKTVEQKAQSIIVFDKTVEQKAWYPHLVQTKKWRESGCKNKCQFRIFQINFKIGCFYTNALALTGIGKLSKVLEHTFVLRTEAGA
jgi:hypothetical protein